MTADQLLKGGHLVGLVIAEAVDQDVRRVGEAVAAAQMLDRVRAEPGQRVLSRGGYLVDLSGQREPVWLVP